MIVSISKELYNMQDLMLTFQLTSDCYIHILFDMILIYSVYLSHLCLLKQHLTKTFPNKHADHPAL